MTKIDTIEKLDNNSLSSLMKTLLEKMGFQSIKEDGLVLRATENSALGVTKHAFIVSIAHLSGNVENEPIISSITKEREEETFNVITIVSNRHISAGFQSTLNRAFAKVRINYIGRDQLIAIIDEQFPDYWRHDDTALIEYEHQYQADIEKENQLKLLHGESAVN